jgi:hypothetical protein
MITPPESKKYAGLETGEEAPRDARIPGQILEALGTAS